MFDKYIFDTYHEKIIKTVKGFVFNNKDNTDLSTHMVPEPNGFIEFDRVIATPSMMPKMSKVAKILGPKGMMPNPKLGTVTNNIEEAVKVAKAGQIEYRAEKKGLIHAGVGKMSFKTESLVENIKALFEQLKKVKPSTSKGQYILGAWISSTQGPGLKVEVK